MIGPELLLEKTSRNATRRLTLESLRVVHFTNPAGRENVVAATDCGPSGRLHPQIAWAKLEVLVHGADLASRQLAQAVRSKASRGKA